MRQFSSLENTENTKNSNENNNLIRISAFPPGQTSWRIDWFGDLSYVDRRARYNQPSVFVHLSPVVPQVPATSAIERLKQIAARRAAIDQKRVWVSIGLLPTMRIGDIWRNQVRVDEPDYTLDTFKDVQIDSSTATLVKAGVKLDDADFLLPADLHPGHMKCTQSYCVVINLPNDQRLVVPCMELARFYFGTTSSVLTRLFKPPLDRKSLYADAQFNTRTGHLEIRLAERISGASAADLGRIHLDKAAWRAASLIGTSMLQGSTSGQQVYAKAMFPFEGKTDLIASGQWLPFNGKAKATFLVFNLRSCSHPFPFKSIWYVMNRPRAARPNGPTPPTGPPSPSRPIKGAGDTLNQPLVEQDPAKHLTPKFLAFSSGIRFPDLENKAVWGSAALLNTGQSVAVAGSAPDVQFGAVGEGTSERRVRPVDLVAASASAMSRLRIPDFLRPHVDQLRKLEGIEVELLTHSESDGWTVPVTVLSDEDGEIDPRLFIQHEDRYDNQERLLKTCVMALKRDSTHIFVVVIEAYPSCARIYHTNGQATEAVSETLRSAAKDFLEEPRSGVLASKLAEEVGRLFGVG